MKSKIIDKILANTPQDVHDSADLFAKEIAAAEKIKLIQKSIEDKTGKPCEIKDMIEGYEIKWQGKYSPTYHFISREALDLLPISDPLEEQPDTLIEFCKWSKKAEWRDGETKRAFIDNDWNKYIELFFKENPNLKREEQPDKGELKKSLQTLIDDGFLNERMIWHSLGIKM